MKRTHVVPCSKCKRSAIRQGDRITCKHCGFIETLKSPRRTFRGDK